MHRLLIAFLIVLAIPCIALATPVPDTGQTTCYDDTQEMTCPNPGDDFYGQDAQYITNTHSYTKLDANGNDLPDNAPWPWAMVKDNVTGLIWEVKTDDGSLHDKDNAYTWESAMAFGTTLNSQNFGGCSDWRLPTIKELSCLADSSNPSGPTINTDYFPNTQSALHWSSTVKTGNPNAAWCCSFGTGTVNSWDVTRNRSFMAVCGELSSNYFVENFDGTITDTSAGLMWQQETAPGSYNWQQALSYCENLTIDEYDDWRVPNRNELHTLVDYGRSGPSINTDYFPDTMADYYFSATTAADWPAGFWGVFFDAGVVYDYFKLTVPYPYLRCVRGAALVDSDADGIPEDVDNCPYNYNPLQLDTYPTGGNGCGDACECHADCNGDQKVNLTDLVTMKAQFFWNCSEHPSCEADCNYDGNVNLSDLVTMKAEFNRTDCPECP